MRHGLILAGMFGWMMNSYAAGIFDITTTTPQITVSPRQTTTLVYQVQNTSGRDMSQMTYFPPPLTTILSDGTTCNHSLLKNDTCIVMLSLTAPGQQGEMILKPLSVCADDGHVCSASDAENRAHLTIGNATVYVANFGSNTVSVIDGASNQVVATIPVGSQPRWYLNGSFNPSAPITPDGTKLYVPNVASGDVSVISTATNSVLTTVPVNSVSSGLVITPDSSKAYIVGAIDTVDVISTASNIVTASISVGLVPLTAAITPNGAKVYVQDQGFGDIAVISTATDTVITVIRVNAFPGVIAMVPDGTKLYVPFDIGLVDVISTATDAVISQITVGSSSPISVYITPDGSKGYLPNGDASSVSVISTLTDSFIKTISTAVGSVDTVLAITPDGTKGYTAGGGNFVDVISTATDTVIASVPVGTNAVSAAVNPDGSKVYIGNDGSANVSVISTATDTVIATVPVGNNPDSIAIL